MLSEKPQMCQLCQDKSCLTQVMGVGTKWMLLHECYRGRRKATECITEGKEKQRNKYFFSLLLGSGGGGGELPAIPGSTALVQCWVPQGSVQHSEGTQVER